ncbi:uncharacterized protein L201_004339 [Kwoniella dendrophila CBS 6074]|uniref:G-patch domain-containing protein n=1 Tax=Kwoniella dendrophila CBS 6074 TaxID=1295534 RepID=A0AAX4JXX8_9TREE
MSLYGGIKFASNAAPEEEDEVSVSPQASSSKSTSSQAENGSASKFASTSLETKKVPAPQKSGGEWSAALKFAPRVKQSKPTNNNSSSRPIGFSTITSTTSSTNPSSSHSPIQQNSESGITPKSDIIRSAEPTISTNNGGVGVGLGTGPIEDEVQFGPDGLPLAKAPAMTLAPKSGAGTGMKGKRGRENDDKKKKKKKKKKNNFGQPFISNFDPEEQYDPNRPNDLGEYQQYRKRLREERRMKLLEERRRKAEGLALSSGESSYYTDSEDEAPVRRDAPKMFAPPKIYSESSSTSTPNFPPPPSITNPPPPQTISGDDAYARRAAMGSSGDDAYARRVAMSQQPASGDDAYARRVAMSQGAPPPSFAPSSSSSQPPPAQQTPSYDIPGFTSSIPAQPPAPTPATAPVPVEADNTDFAKMLEDRKKAAEAIAAKFKALTGGSSAAGPSNPPTVPTPTAPVEEDSGTGTFAEKMMRKWGHQEGSTLGIRNEGLIHALTAEHVTTQPVLKPGEQLSKRQIAKQKAALANAKNRKWVQNLNSRGKIINQNLDSKLMDEKEKKGEESRIICLVGIVSSVDEIDEDLSDEIGEECSKYGIVERVVLHMVEPPPVETSECLRIFVVFSGMAGAWRATKELDGRFFGGKKIRVTYFNEDRFNGGDRDGEILG